VVLSDAAVGFSQKGGVGSGRKPLAGHPALNFRGKEMGKGKKTITCRIGRQGLPIGLDTLN